VRLSLILRPRPPSSLLFPYTTLFRSWLASRTTRALVLVAAALVPALFLSLAFPEGGPEPFVGSSFWPTVITIGLVLAALHRNSRSEEHTSELQSRGQLVCRLLLEKKK